KRDAYWLSKWLKSGPASFVEATIKAVRSATISLQSKEASNEWPLLCLPTKPTQPAKRYNNTVTFSALRPISYEYSIYLNGIDCNCILHSEMGMDIGNLERGEPCSTA